MFTGFGNMGIPQKMPKKATEPWVVLKHLQAHGGSGNTGPVAKCESS